MHVTGSHSIAHPGFALGPKRKPKTMEDQLHLKHSFRPGLRGLREPRPG